MSGFRAAALALALPLIACVASAEEREMTQVHVRAPVPSADEAAARIDAWLDEHDERGRTPLHGIPPEAAATPVLNALTADQISADRMTLLATSADAFRVRAAGPLFLDHARVEHATFDGYRARIAALRGAATTAPSPAEVPEAGRSLLVALVDDPAAAQALPELLGAFVANRLDFAALERRVPEIVARLDAAGQTDDGKRLQARGVEEFGLNDIPRARLAVGIMKEIRTIKPGTARLDALTAIHVGEDLRFREHLLPFAIRLLQDAALAGHEAAVAAAFLRAYGRAGQQAQDEVRRVRQAIAAQAAAWFGAELDASAAEAAAKMPPPDAGLFGTALVPLDH